MRVGTGPSAGHRFLGDCDLAGDKTSECSSQMSHTLRTKYDGALCGLSDGHAGSCRRPLSVEKRREWFRVWSGSEYRSAMLSEQLGLCAYCSLPLALEDAVADHDHACCSVNVRWVYRCGRCERGIVHARCNTAIGQTLANIDYVRLYEERFT